MSNEEAMILGNTCNLNDNKMQVELNYLFEAEGQSRTPVWSYKCTIFFYTMNLRISSRLARVKNAFT